MSRSELPNFMHCSFFSELPRVLTTFNIFTFMTKLTKDFNLNARKNGTLNN